MDYFVTSFDDPRKMLKIVSIGGSASGDIGIDTGWLTGAYLLSPLGAGNSHYTSPVYDAALNVIRLFNRNKGHLLQAGKIEKDEIDFSFNWEDVITFATPDNIPNIASQRLSFVKSKTGFFGISTTRNFLKEPVALKQDDIVWLCGPDNKEMKKKFGAVPYDTRRRFFGSLYDMAAAEPPRMQNPIYPMAEGLHYILKAKGNRHALH